MIQNTKIQKVGSNVLNFLASIIALAVSGGLFSSCTGASPKKYDFTIQREMIQMPDGVSIAVTWYRPVEQVKNQKFPILFEMHPYRKDDLFLRRDYSLYTYFARAGFAIAKADVRGTGSSEGAIPNKEYSEQELEDGIELIRILSIKEFSNGNVGMFGISWSGFNAIQIAMRNPPELKAIMAADATDDLFHDDVHYIDGVFHIDQYALSVENDLSLPAWPDYKLDSHYFKNRFDQYPWFLTYRKHQQDGDFWKENSLRYDYSKIKVPVFLIGGLLDGYRDAVPRMLEKLDAPVLAVIGPWNHAWPDDGEPGPVFEWRKMMVQWWTKVLVDSETIDDSKRGDSTFDDKNLLLFVRAGDKPDIKLENATGSWHSLNWPLPFEKPSIFYLNKGGSLVSNATKPPSDHLNFSSLPSSGSELGYWWGENTGDLAKSAEGALVFQTSTLNSENILIGTPRVKIRAAILNHVHTNWIIRVEDVDQFGNVALVSGGALNSSQRENRLNPSAVPQGKYIDYEFDLHFTTWTFQPGHRIRLTITNSQFPMFWPLPKRIESSIELGAATRIELPFVSKSNLKGSETVMTKPLGRESLPDSEELASQGWPYFFKSVQMPIDSIKALVWKGEDRFRIGAQNYFYFENTHYQTDDVRPSDSLFLGNAGHSITLKSGRQLDVSTDIKVQSDQKNFNIEFSRKLFENKKLVRQKTWKEAIPRNFQ